MSKKHPVKYYNDIEILDNSEKLNSSPNHYEKIRLEFSILHANKGSYSIQAKLYDQQVFDFFSETKKVDTKQTLVFGNFFNCNFYFQKEQKLFVTLNKNNTPFKIEITLGCIVGSKDCTFSQNFFNDESLVIKAEKLEKEEDILALKLNLKEINSDPNFFFENEFYYLITSRRIDIYESSESQKDGSFIPVQIPTNLLKPSYTVSIYNLSNNKLVFSFDRSIQQIKNHEKFKIKIQLPNNSYVLFEDNSEIIKNYTFIDYIKSGVKIALSIGIDFTGSNGHPLDPGSLHSIHGPNDYERAITSCGKIVGNYDYDQLFPVYGFGAIVNSSYSKELSMCFNLNLTSDPNINTMDNVIKTYHEIIEKDRLTFAGPTEFTPLIREVISRIDKKDILEYHILLILTDGVIDDLQETIDILVEASILPLSVIIIGIGNADFKEMEILDGDEVPLTSSKGKKRMRDLVQFVPFSKYQNNAEKLSMEVLAEIPRQIVEYYQFKNLNPNQIEKLLNKQSKINLFNPNANANPKNDITQQTKQIDRKFNNTNYYTFQQLSINNNDNNNLKQANKFVENKSYYTPNQNQFIINIDNNNIINNPKPINKIVDNNSYYTPNQKQFINNTNNNQNQNSQFVYNKSYYSNQNYQNTISTNLNTARNNNLNTTRGSRGCNPNSINLNQFNNNQNNNIYQRRNIPYRMNPNQINIQNNNGSLTQRNNINIPNPFNIGNNINQNINININNNINSNNNIIGSSNSNNSHNGMKNTTKRLINTINNLPIENIHDVNGIDLSKLSIHETTYLNANNVQNGK